MVYGFSQIITKVFDVIVLPFGSNRMLALSVISLLTGVALIFLFKATSDQKRIKATRDKFKARILEMRLYQDDIILIHKALFAALGTNLAYLRVSLKPILVLLAFVFLIFIQLDERYGRGYLEPGGKSLLTVVLKDGLDPMSTSFDLSAGGGVAVDSPPVRSTVERSINWRIRVEDEGSHHLDVKVIDNTYRLPITAERSNAPIGFVRTAGSFSNPLLHPGLPKIPGDSPIQSVELHYPSASYSLFGWKTHWLVVFIIFSFVGALIPKFIFKIEI
jgi:uncharacterized membrane protein (DUF106 family)